MFVEMLLASGVFCVDIPTPMVTRPGLVYESQAPHTSLTVFPLVFCRLKVVDMLMDGVRAKPAFMPNVVSRPLAVFLRVESRVTRMLRFTGADTFMFSVVMRLSALTV